MGVEIDVHQLDEASYKQLEQLAKGARVVDDALHNVLENLLTKSRPTHPGYVKKSVKNASVDLWRASQRRGSYESAFALTAPREDLSTPAQSLTVSRAIESLIEFVGGLSALDQELFERFFLDDQSTKHISELLGLHNSTIEKRVAKLKRRCLALLQEHLSD